MKKTYLPLLFLLFSYTASAQFGGYPEIPKYTKNITGFVPQGWKILTRAEGDLNKDGLPDVALVLQSRAAVPPPEEEREWTGPYYPRMLVILFWDDKAKCYRLVERSDTFVITDEGNRTMSEPFTDMEIRSNGTLRFDFNYWYSAGTWWMGKSVYIFRFQNGRFELIGQELSSIHRATHASTGVSINYSTGKAIISSSEDEDDPGRTEMVFFDIEELPTFLTIGEAKFVPEIELPSGEESY